MSHSISHTGSVSEHQSHSVSIRTSVSQRQYQNISLTASVSEHQSQDITFRTSVSQRQSQNISLTASVSQHQYQTISLTLTASASTSISLLVREHASYLPHRSASFSAIHQPGGVGMITLQEDSNTPPLMSPVSMDPVSETHKAHSSVAVPFCCCDKAGIGTHIGGNQNIYCNRLGQGDIIYFKRYYMLSQCSLMVNLGVIWMEGIHRS
jgi:hypothetical protein